MQIFADLHIHSHYSRATSQKMRIEELAKYAKIKGVDILGTGDFTHPSWLNELKQKLSFCSEGIYEYDKTRFILSGEISLIYTQDGKMRRIHNIILAPSFEIVEQINEWLASKGRLDYDGRPIFGFTCPELVENLISMSKDIEIIPAHVWTPWFSLFGSMSGFDSVEECFQDKTDKIHALETGLSSDPSMNWRLSSLDKYALVSFSDSHSAYPWRLGRECCVFNLKEFSYYKILEAIKNKDKKRFLMTIEFFPEEGKYHYDGHRNCNFSCSPKEAMKLNNICPKCGKRLTIGVLHRVEELADRKEGSRPKDAIDYKSLIPLSELISAVMGSAIYSKKVYEEYNKMIDRFGSEFNVLLNVPKQELEKVTKERIAEIIIKNREGRIKIQPGYDGVYGRLMLNSEMEQKSLGDF